jgi:hypothetical protein
MKKTLLVGGLAAMTLGGALAGVAVAQQAPAITQDRPARAMRADTDGDSRISQAEFVGARMQRLTALDANSDGSVTVEERRAARETRRTQRADARFERLDANDDGSISRAEFDARKDARADRPRRMRAHRGHGPARMARMEARGPVVVADARAKAEQAFARLDGDHDGYVTADERRAGRRALREQRRERMAERRAARQAQPQASPQAPASE